MKNRKQSDKSALAGIITDIAERLIGIHKDDLTTAEGQIVRILVDATVLVITPEGSIEWA